MDFDTWECPDCGWIITDTQYQRLRYDYGCPRCSTKLEDFNFIPAVEEE